MPLSLFESALGGIGLFLFGMRLMSDGIRTVADDRIRSVFATITSNRFTALLTGLFLALSLNSATAAVIFAIGLTNAGVLNAFQAMSVLSGVLLGAAVTLYLPWIPYGLVATPLVFIGVVLKFFSHRRRLANLGNLLLGVGLLFLGLSLLEGCFQPSGSHPFYGSFHTAFFELPFPAMVLGSMISCFVPSAPASASVIASLVSSHDMSSAVASSMMLGGLIGIAAIVGVASIGGTSVSRRIAVAFIAISLVVVLPLVAASHYLSCIPGFGMPAGLSGSPLYGTTLFRHLVAVFTLGCIVAAVLTSALGGLVSRITRAADANGRNGTVHQPCAGFIDMRILNTPTLAIDQARKEITRMIQVMAYMYVDTRELLFDFDARRAETIRQHEQVLDSLNHEVTSFLAALAHATTNSEITYEIPGMLQTVADLEHIGDRCEDVLDSIVSRKESNIIFSADAMIDLKRLATAVGSSVSQVEAVFGTTGNYDSEAVRHHKMELRDIFDDIKRLHFERISSGTCPPRAAMLFNEMTTAFMRIAELCWNVMAVQGRKAV